MKYVLTHATVFDGYHDYVLKHDLNIYLDESSIKSFLSVQFKASLICTLLPAVLLANFR